MLKKTVPTIYIVETTLQVRFISLCFDDIQLLRKGFYQLLCNDKYTSVYISIKSTSERQTPSIEKVLTLSTPCTRPRSFHNSFTHPLSNALCSPSLLEITSTWLPIPFVYLIARKAHGGVQKLDILRCKHWFCWWLGTKEGAGWRIIFCTEVYIYTSSHNTSLVSSQTNTDNTEMKASPEMVFFFQKATWMFRPCNLFPYIDNVRRKKSDPPVDHSNPFIFPTSSCKKLDQNSHLDEQILWIFAFVFDGDSCLRTLVISTLHKQTHGSWLFIQIYKV